MDSIPIDKKHCEKCNGVGWSRKGYAVLHGFRIMHMTAYQPCKQCFGFGLVYKTLEEIINDKKDV